MAGVQGYRLFNVQLARKTEVSPSLLNLVFSGQEVAQTLLYRDGLGP